MAELGYEVLNFCFQDIRPTVSQPRVVSMPLKIIKAVIVYSDFSTIPLRVETFVLEANVHRLASKPRILTNVSSGVPLLAITVECYLTVSVVRRCREPLRTRTNWPTAQELTKLKCVGLIWKDQIISKN